MIPYSSIAHLAMTAWPSRAWRQLLMASFTACFDASGQEHEHGYVVVAGFVSTAEEWISFSEKWNETLKRYGLTEFHANHCQN